MAFRFNIYLIFYIPQRKANHLLTLAPGLQRSFRYDIWLHPDSSGDPLIGASILVKGTTLGTVTDLDGRLEIHPLQSYPTLIISYTGFATQEFSPRGPEVDINLAENAQYLEAVTVTGYKLRQRIWGSVDPHRMPLTVRGKVDRAMQI
ncbi:carboxypeptidase-like regulatory domain-containing protein [Okeania hirsuta]|uniref:carboxypeptidase-like regulatory domain-containing protein n=1 Tax=Okeania hirsuta TaxID=1458930 RepID=UPI001374E066